MRQDRSAADRVFAESAEGLANSDPVRIQKMYVIMNDQDAKRLDDMVKDQWIISTWNVNGMEDFLHRVNQRGALVFDRPSVNIAGAVAGCEGLLLVADPRMVKRYGLDVKLDLRGKFQTGTEALNWCLQRYGDRINRKIVALSGGLNLFDYEVANRVVELPTQDLSSESLQSTLVTQFYPNIPCLGDVPGGPKGQSIIDNLSSAAKYWVPTDRLSNLSMLTTFEPAAGEFSEQAKSGASRQPRGLRGVDPDTRFPTELDLGKPDENAGPKERVMSPKLNCVLVQLAPPLAPKHYDKSQDFQLGFISQSLYGQSYAGDRDRIWADYQWLGDQVQHRAR